MAMKAEDSDSERSNLTSASKTCYWLTYALWFSKIFLFMFTDFTAGLIIRKHTCWKLIFNFSPYSLGILFLQYIHLFQMHTQNYFLNFLFSPKWCHFYGISNWMLFLFWLLFSWMILTMTWVTNIQAELKIHNLTFISNMISVGRHSSRYYITAVLIVDCINHLHLPDSAKLNYFEPFFQRGLISLWELGNSCLPLYGFWGNQINLWIKQNYNLCANLA